MSDNLGSRWLARGPLRCGSGPCRRQLQLRWILVPDAGPFGVGLFDMAGDILGPQALDFCIEVQVEPTIDDGPYVRIADELLADGNPVGTVPAVRRQIFGRIGGKGFLVRLADEEIGHPIVNGDVVAVAPQGLFTGVVGDEVVAPDPHRAVGNGTGRRLEG